jgi:P27 family predicted phage terminase small subunit
MDVLNGSGQIVAEPDWTQVYSDVLKQVAAAEHWRVITTGQRDRNLLAPDNANEIERLVHFYLVYDEAFKEVSEHGAVTKPKRSSPKAIARVSPHFLVMKETSAHAAMLEAELGISPRRRAGATTAAGKMKNTKASDSYLTRVK